jgi:glutathione synthase/RimK-type ligase-like ATP-grasp enzyme
MWRGLCAMNWPKALAAFYRFKPGGACRPFFSLMPKIALATCSKYPNLTADDRLLLEPLASYGLQAEAAVWNDERYPWSACDAVVIRSCWDYHLQPDKFLHWIGKLEATRTPLFNSPALVRWNANKSYLNDLDTKGVAIVPTLWAEDDVVPLKEKLLELNWDQAVVKPRISATAYRTQLVSAVNADHAQELFNDLRCGPGVMVQKFMGNITTDGEWSLIFFAGAFSHAVLKKPQPGDFRVQNDFGGTWKVADPPRHVLDSAAHSVRSVDSTIYARVDGVIDDGQFRLMELELIEPMLFLADHPQAPARFADAIWQAFSSGG